MGKKKTWLKNVSDNWLRENINQLRPCDVFHYRKLSESLVREFDEDLDWHILCEKQSFEENFCREFQDKIGMNLMFCQRLYSEKFIEEVLTELSGYERLWIISSICRTQKVSERFIERWFEDVDWNEVSKNQKLTDDFMRKYKKKLNWILIKDREDV